MEEHFSGLEIHPKQKNFKIQFVVELIDAYDL